MPRKRKNLKRELSEAAGPGARDASAAPSDASNSASTAATNASRLAASELAGNAPSNHSRHDDGEIRPLKRPRQLTEAEEEHLGKPVGLSRWLEIVRQGRGAAACILAQVDQFQLVWPEKGGACSLDLSCIDPNPSNISHPSPASVFIHPGIAERVFEALRLLEKLGPPAMVFISGFSANVSWLSPDRPLITFDENKLIMRMSAQPTFDSPSAPLSAIWIQQLQSHATSSHPASKPSLPHSVAPAPAPAPAAPAIVSTVGHRAPAINSAPPVRLALGSNPSATPTQSSDWFSTPAPDSDPPQQRSQPNTSANTDPTNSTSTLALPPLPPVKNESPHRTSVAAPTSNPQGDTVNNVGSSRQASLRRSISTPSRSVSSVPQPPRRNAPNVKPRRMGNCLYTPISLVRDGEKASIIGVVLATGSPRRSTRGTGDISIKITVADASCLSGTGYAKCIAQSMTIMLFAPSDDRIPHPIAPGQIFAARSVHIQMFSGKPQAVGKSAAPWSWAIYDPVSGDLRASSNFPLVNLTPPECSPEEMEHFRELSNWYTELQGVDANVITRSSRPTIKLENVEENLFFDTVVEVLKVYTHTIAPDLYVTDYTHHSLFYRGNDRYLQRETPLPYPDETDGWGHVFQISLWDSHATIAEGLQTGDIIRIQNVRAKLNPRGLLTGGLGSNTDSGIKIRTLKATDEARIELEKRKAAFIQILFEAEEQAVADRMEREISENAHHSQRRNHHASDENAGQSKAQRITDRVETGRGEVASAIERRTATPTAVKPRRVQEASPASVIQQPFPTPAQRHLQAVQITPPQRAGLPQSVDLDYSSTMPPPDVKPPASSQLESPQPLIRCNAPASIDLTNLATLQTTSLCPEMYKVKAQIISTNPEKVENWARVECKSCNRLLPMDQRFCVKCGDEEGGALSYCLRFAVMLQETESEWRKRVGAGGKGERVTVPLLFHGKSSEALLPSINAKGVFHTEKSAIKMLKRFANRLLHPEQYGKDPEMVLAVYSFPSKEADKTVRRFAALKELNVLQSPMDLL